jgi:hypothetical protein
MGKMEGAKTSTTTAAPNEVLIPPAEAKEVLGLSGCSTKQIYGKTKDDVLYTVKRKCGWTIKVELYAGAQTAADPLITVKENCAWSSKKSGLKSPLKLTASPSQNGEEIATMLPTSFWRMNRRFNVQGEEYQWRFVAPWLSHCRFVLEHINAAGANTVIAELAVSCWTGKGTLTIRQTEHELPRDVIIATGIAMEAIRHQGGN